MRGAKTIVAAVMVGACLASTAAAQHVLNPVKTTTPPVIDGRVDPDEWRDAALAAHFLQFEPRRGEPSTLGTEALVLYDDRMLYVAFKAPDAEPSVAALTQRDADLFGDDSVIVVLDTFFDRQSAYYFVTNALGTQADGRVGDDGRTIDVSWDAPWRSASRREEGGWTAEIAIPLSAIKYVAGSERRWGINLGRVRRRSLEISFWAGPLDARLRVSQSGHLAGLNLPVPERRHQIVPYALSRVQEAASPDWEGGVDVRYALTPSMAVYGTLYPDFATVEADQEQVNLTRFEVSLREKRQFFLEGQELFNQRIRTFYSRRIADVDFGGKLLGKHGPWGVALLNAQSTPTAIDGRANYTVGRLQRDLGRSNVAATFATRRFRGIDEGSGSIDTTLFFSKTWGLTGQVAKGFGQYRRGTWAYFIRPSYDSATGHFHLRYTHLGDRFGDTANAVGLVRDDNRRELDSQIAKTVWVRSGRVEKVDYNSNYNAYWSQHGDLRSWRIDEVLDTELRNRWGARATWSEEYIVFEKGFRNRQVGLEIGFNTRSYQSVQGGIQFGRNFDAEYRLWLVEARRKITDGLSVEYELQRLTLNPDPDRSGTWIHVVRAHQAFTKDLMVRAFFQTNSAIARNHVEAVFVYRYLPPFGTLQVVYQRGAAEFGRRSTQGHTLFLKATTVL
jgi:hypothetical protein